jgi:Flp pilus assembly protein CpaB
MKQTRTRPSDNGLPRDPDAGRPVVALRDERNGAKPPLRTHRLLQPLVLVGALLVLIAFVVVLGVYASATSRQRVLVAARPLSAGTLVAESDLRSVGIAASGEVLGTLVTPRDLSAVVGHRLSVPIASGAPLPRTALAPLAAGSSSFTLVVPFGHALGGNLHPGDRVTVLATFGTDASSAQARAIARDLVVLDVGRSSSVGDPNTAVIPVTVELPDASLATELALANSTAKIDLLREPARGTSAPIPSARAGAHP